MVTYPTNTKLAIKIIHRLNKLAKAEGIGQRCTFVKEVKVFFVKEVMGLACRGLRYVKKRSKAKKSPKILRTAA